MVDFHCACIRRHAPWRGHGVHRIGDNLLYDAVTNNNEPVCGRRTWRTEFHSNSMRKSAPGAGSVLQTQANACFR